MSTSLSAPPPLSRRGSTWNKWDLHVHTPASVFNNQFPHNNGAPDWESYLSAVEALTDVAVLGATDYFSIDGYKRLREYREQGRMSNIALLLPNIELRLDLLVPTSSSDEAGKTRKVNAHVIFSDEVSPEDIEDKFLRQLHFSGLGDPQSTNEPCALTRHQLEQLGARLRHQQPTFSGNDYEIGCMNAAVSFERVKKVLHDHRSTFSCKFLVVLATENTSLISWEGQGHLLRKVLVQGSDAIFGGQPNDRRWFLGQKGSTPRAFIEEFGTLKACLHGSDAHGLSNLCKPDKERFCWIKADTTFEGLRQIIFEPEDRVFIGDNPPNFKHSYRVIESLSITDAPDWFPFSPINLNSNLVTIIGGKGAGKSALAELIAFAGGSEFFKGGKNKNLDDTFVSKASKRTVGNLKPITGAKIKLVWVDGSSEEVELTDSLSHGQQEEKVKYLPQKFVERVCAPEHHGELLLEVERVVFQRIPKSDRLGAVTFADLRHMRTKGIQVKKDHLASEIEELNRKIYTGYLKAESKPEKTKLLAQSRKEFTELTKQKPEVSTENAADIQKLDGLQVSLTKLNVELTNLKQRLSLLDELEAVLASVRLKVAGHTLEIKTLLDNLGLKVEASAFEIVVPDEIDAALNSARETANLEIEVLVKGPREQPTINGITQEMKQASETLQLSKSKRAEFDKFEADRLALEETIKALETEVALINEAITKELAVNRDARLGKYLDFFEILKEEKESLNELYRPLRESLESGGATDQKLKFASRITFDSGKHAQAGMELFDTRRRARFKDHESLQAAIKKTVESLQAVEFDREASRERFVKFRESFLVDSDNKPITIGEQLRRNKTEEDFNNWFFNLSRYAVSYSITFEGKDLELLSPGQKGIVLLLVYLEIDQDDQRPLIIDQPEDNLDNLSVYANLIEFFRKRKLMRQLILITHNPNLVVNTDSEQIIIASYDGAANPKITYRSGALEETSVDPPGIREQVCAILEGGSEAFQKREMKYSLL